MKMPKLFQSIFSQCLLVVMFLAAGLVSLIADDADAQLRVEITEGQVAPTPIAIAEFTGPDGNVTEVGRQLTQIISDDLDSSGLFRPVDSAAFIDPPKAPSVKPNFANWSPLGVKGLLVGSAHIDDAGMLQVEFVLWDVVIQRNITAGGGNADQSGLRRLAHQIADFVYEEFTGDSGYFDTQVVYVVWISKSAFKTARHYGSRWS
jgi:TolB protein